MSRRMLKSYLQKHWIIYSLMAGYAVVLLLKSMGLQVWTPSCPISAYTNYECLGCGMNHAAMSLMRLDFAEAWMHNPLIFVYLPIIFGWISYDFYKYSTKLKPQK